MNWTSRGSHSKNIGSRINQQRSQEALREMLRKNDGEAIPKLKTTLDGMSVQILSHFLRKKDSKNQTQFVNLEPYEKKRSFQSSKKQVRMRHMSSPDSPMTIPSKLQLSSTSPPGRSYVTEHSTPSFRNTGNDNSTRFKSQESQTSVISVEDKIIQTDIIPSL